MTELPKQDIATGLEEIRDRIERTEFDDQTPEEKIRELQKTLRSGDDPVYILDQAVEALTGEE